MAYDNDFYWAYEDYLIEPTVRRAHNKVFKLLENNDNFKRVIDLGCGFSSEYFRWGDAKWYSGIDQNIKKDKHEPSGFMGVKQGDYRDKEFLRLAIEHETAFISLFSSEVHAPYIENYKLYNWIFQTFPKIQAGLVGGLYHSNRKEENPMIANGNTIYQTLESIEDCDRIGYTEERIIIQVPSKLFGEHEVEVWKIFTRI